MIYKYKEIGEILRKRRIELGRDLTGIAEETRVLEKYLIAIEEGDIKEFFSPVYYNLFARSYAKELGLDDEELFRKEVEPEELPKPPNSQGVGTPVIEPQKAETSPKRPSLIAFLSFGGIIVLCIAIILFIILRGNTPQENQMANSERPSVAGNFISDSTFSANDSSTIDTLVPENIQDRTMRLRITVREACWFMVLADGDTALSGSLSPGTSQDLTAINSFIISAGNPSGVEIRLNDTLLKPLSPAGKPIRGVEINRDNKSGFFSLPGESSSGRH